MKINKFFLTTGGPGFDGLQGIFGAKGEPGAPGLPGLMGADGPPVSIYSLQFAKLSLTATDLSFC